ncbi:MAG: hypothetical protein ACKVON_13075 [Beijerinckiaceae bacterium]
MSISKFAAIAFIVMGALTGTAQAQGRDAGDPPVYRPYNRNQQYQQPQQYYQPQQQYANSRIARKEAELAERRARKGAQLRERSYYNYGGDPYSRQGYSYNRRGYDQGYGYQQPRYRQPRGQYYYYN